MIPRFGVSLQDEHTSDLHYNVPHVVVKKFIFMLLKVTGLKKKVNLQSFIIASNRLLPLVKFLSLVHHNFPNNLVLKIVFFINRLRIFSCSQARGESDHKFQIDMLIPPH